MTIGISDATYSAIAQCAENDGNPLPTSKCSTGATTLPIHTDFSAVSAKKWCFSTTNWLSPKKWFVTAYSIIAWIAKRGCGMLEKTNLLLKMSVSSLFSYGAKDKQFKQELEELKERIRVKAFQLGQLQTIIENDRELLKILLVSSFTATKHVPQPQLEVDSPPADHPLTEEWRQLASQEHYQDCVIKRIQDFCVTNPDFCSLLKSKFAEASLTNPDLLNAMTRV